MHDPSGPQDRHSTAVRTSRVPNHVAVIMDGNGRWAQARGHSRSEGHRAGLAAARRVVERLARRGVTWITLFAFSSENWHRPQGEVDALMALFARALSREAGRLAREGLQLRFVGDRTRFPERLVSAMARAERDTAANTGPVLCVALGYGGRWDLVEAARRVAADPTFQADVTALDQAAFRAALPSGALPDVDLLVRTGGERRISNFLLWQAAYAELMFPDVLWPDVSVEMVDEWLADFAARERRFGRVTAPSGSVDDGDGSSRGAGRKGASGAAADGPADTARRATC